MHTLSNKSRSQRNSIKNRTNLQCLHAKYSSVVHPQLELEDPTPDINRLFEYFNVEYFRGKLSGVKVLWSNNLYRCSGTCFSHPVGKPTIFLSAPLLKFRTRADLVQSLLHEMIHAYLYITDNSSMHESHDLAFQEINERIKKISGAKMEISHNFHDEVKHFQSNWWRCNGPCRDKYPHFGIVKRAMDRAPGTSDPWFSTHSRICGGQFIKVKEETAEHKPKKSDKIIKQEITQKPENKLADNKPSVNKQKSRSNSRKMGKRSNVNVSNKKYSNFSLFKQFGDNFKKSLNLKYSINPERIIGLQNASRGFLRITAQNLLHHIKKRNLHKPNRVTTPLDNSNSNNNDIMINCALCNDSIPRSHISDHEKYHCLALLRDDGNSNTDFKSDDQYSNFDCNEYRKFIKEQNKQFKTAFCPNCNIQYSMGKIAEHIDECLKLIEQ